MLIFWHTVENTIVYFFALVVVIEIPELYVNALLEDKLKDKLLESAEKTHGLHISNRGREIKFSSRPCYNKI